MKDKSPVEQLVLELCFCITQKRDALAQIVHAVKMVENGGILATNHNRSTTKYYFPHLWRNLTKPDIFRSYYPTKPYIFRRDQGFRFCIFSNSFFTKSISL